MNQNPQLDLHIHTPYSDGSWSIEKIVSNSRKPIGKVDLDMIAISDHNTLNGLHEFKHVLEKFNENQSHPLIGIGAIEISASYLPDTMDQEIHVLGYFPLNSDFESEPFSSLQQCIDAYKNSKNRQLEMILENIIQDGYSELSVQEFYEFAYSISADGNLNRPSIARYLQKKGLVPSVSEAFDRFIGKDCKYFLELGKPTLEEVIHAINKANGISVIAHLGEYPFDERERKEFFKFCNDCHIRGYEVFHPHNTEDIICAILNEAEKNPDLILTQGSDFHGLEVKPNNHLGECISKDLKKQYQAVLNRVSKETAERLAKLDSIHFSEEM